MVLINGRQAVLGECVSSNDIVTVNGLVVRPLADSEVIFIALNKPVGIVCTAAESVSQNIVKFIDHESRIFPIGRLDKNTQGLIFLTNRCELVNKILCSDHSHEKEYVVTVNKEITDEFIAGVRGGVPMLGKTTKKCYAVKESTLVFRITLIQGLNRQIRRMCKHYGYSVVKLERVRVMNIDTTGLSPGQWRNLTREELTALYGKLDHSLAQ